MFELGGVRMPEGEAVMDMDDDSEDWECWVLLEDDEADDMFLISALNW